MTTSTPDREPTRQVAARYPASVVARLDALAAAERRDRSDVLRLLVEDGLPARERAAGIAAPKGDGLTDAQRLALAQQVSGQRSHPFEPQPNNSRCATCGGKPGDHR